MKYNMQITYYNIMLLSKCRRSGQRTMETGFGSRIAADKLLRSRPRNNIYMNGLYNVQNMGNDDNKYLYILMKGHR